MLIDDLERREIEPLDGTEGLYFYWSCWQQLSNRRTRGMAGANPVQFSEIESWLDAQCVRGELRELTHAYMARLDGYYMNWLSKKLAK